MRTIIITEQALREAIEASVEQVSPTKLGEIAGVAIREEACDRIADDICTAVTEAFENNLTDSDSDKIFDAIIDQAQRVGTVTDLL